MEKDSSKQIVALLDAIGKMLAFLIVKDLETVKDKVIRLRKVGLPVISIADILGVKKNHVEVTLSNARKAGEI